jgi:hypothetical protein
MQVTLTEKGISTKDIIGKILKIVEKHLVLLKSKIISL